LTVDLNSPPIGAIKNIPQLIAALKQKAQSTPKGQWVTGRGYDDTLLSEMRHPTRDDLDMASTEHPIWITHVSGHLGVANSLALKRAKISRDTPQPGGGRIRLDEKTGEPNGVIEESLSLVTRLIPAASADDQLRATQAAVEQYVRRGVTTAVLAGGSAQSIEHLRGAIERGIIQFRIVTMTSGGPVEQARKSIEEFGSPLLKAGAIKLSQDGSIQGYTGYLSEPYFVAGGREASYRGYALRSRQVLTERVVELHRAGYQIAIHGNGDQAIDDILHAFAEAQRSMPRSDARHRIEHCQTARDDQLERMKSLSITPSFFVGHVYYWGDRHRELFLGPERAARISPLASAAGLGIRFTLHDDTPVTPVNPLQLVWVAANRLTTGGRVLGTEQRIDVERALRAVTADAAWQNFEEDIKGTLAPGKLADFCILNGNPLTVERSTIRDLRIVETVVGGKTIYRGR
jgi:predicted amidohydrolase YtcJ